MYLWQLRQKQSLDLESKIEMTKNRIKNWYRKHNKKIYVAFSGGKDSTVLLHIVRSMYKHVPAVFVDTGLEYPEIRDFIKTIDNVIWLKPKYTFKKIIEKYGYPVISKQISRFLNDCQNASEKNKATVNLRLTGYNRKGVFCSTQKLPEKWKYLINSGFKFSEKCCDYLKKNPMHKYEKETGRLPVIGTMAYESNMREKQWLKTGCNAFDQKKPQSKPLSFCLEKDIWNYKDKFNLKFSDIYKTEKRTGCMFCLFGCHLEKEPNRIQRLKLMHPKIYKYILEKLNYKELMELLNIKY